MSFENKKRKTDNVSILMDEMEGVLREQIAELAEKDKLIAEKDELIKELEETIEELKKQHAKLKDQENDDEEDLSDEENELDANDPWDAKCIQLREYHMMNGNCNVPRSHQSLGRWVDGQRTAFKKGKLSQERVILLEGLGFSWGKAYPPPMTFEEGLEELKKFKTAMGHCNVFVGPKNPSQLAKWCGVQRNEYKRFRKQTISLLDLKKIGHLKAIGFKWKTPTNK